MKYEYFKKHDNTRIKTIICQKSDYLSTCKSFYTLNVLKMLL